MGLLDHLVGSLISNATGMRPRNARRIARSIGGGNILMMGGAALAGGLLSGKLGEAGSGGTSAPATPSAPLPPVPKLAPEPDLPPIPVLAEAPPPEQARIELALARTMIAAAWADGHLAAGEREVIDRELAAANVDMETLAAIHRDMEHPIDHQQIASFASGDDDRRALYRCAALIATADRNVDGAERLWLDGLAAALGFDTPTAAAIEAELPID